jgi:heme-degrading monooxygenase HmoA
MKLLLNYVTLSILALNLCSCFSKTPTTENIQSQQSLADTSLLKTLTITKVKKPWYAWRSLVVGKMKKSIPEYSAIKGLQQKYYCFEKSGNYFGGIYFWENEQDSKNWFNPAWFLRTEKKYGVQGIVLSFQILNIKTNSLPKNKKVNLIAALAPLQQDLMEDLSTQKGLLQVVELKDEIGKITYLSIWSDQNDVDSFFKSALKAPLYFDIPLLLR